MSRRARRDAAARHRPRRGGGRRRNGDVQVGRARATRGPDRPLSRSPGRPDPHGIHLSAGGHRGGALREGERSCPHPVRAWQRSDRVASPRRPRRRSSGNIRARGPRRHRWFQHPRSECASWCLELLHKIDNRRRANYVGSHQLLDRLGGSVEHHALMTTGQQPMDHVGAHTAESDHSELHSFDGLIHHSRVRGFEDALNRCVEQGVILGIRLLGRQPLDQRP